MGGAVSSGIDNNELIDNLMGGNYIRTRAVEKVFRALDRADYMTPESRDEAYKDLAWRNGPLHMSAPCIYSEVMEGLDLKSGHSFLNIGSGTGYLSTLVGMIIGSGGINHGVEVHPVVVEYANKKLVQFIENSPTLDEFDFGKPEFYCGNGLCLAPLQTAYDRVYCGAGCPEEYENYFRQLIKVGGVLVMPLNDNLVRVVRCSEDEWRSRSLLNVSFATLRAPSREEAADLIKLEELRPARLQALARARVRAEVRAALLARSPGLRAPRRAAPRASPRACPRRICIPIEDGSDVEGLNELHDLDPESGANEMNALLSLVLSMGQNRVAGALRFDSLDSPTPPSSDEEEEDGESGDDAAEPEGSPPAGGGGAPRGEGRERARRGVLTFRLRNNVPERASDADSALTVETNQNSSESSKTESSTSTTTDTEITKTEPETPKTETRHLKTDTRHISVMSGNRKIDSGSATLSSGNKESSSDLTSGTHEETDQAPGAAEVELCLKSTTGASNTSRLTDMDWEETVGKTHSSEEETIETSKELKRQKLDSGIGEENTPSSGSPTDKTESKSEDEGSDAGGAATDSLTDDFDDEIRGRGRQKRRRHVQSRSSSSSSGGGSARSGRRVPRRRSRADAPLPAAPPPAPDARRERLARAMRSSLLELPLPPPLRSYLNYGREFHV